MTKHKKICCVRVARAAKFSLLKNYRDLKICCFLFANTIYVPSFYFIEQSPKLFILFYFNMGKLFADLV